MRTIEYANSFKRDYRNIKRNSQQRSVDKRLEAALELLAADEPLPAANRDHALTGNWVSYRECHLRPDLLLIYKKHGEDVLQLARLGSHSELFG